MSVLLGRIAAPKTRLLPVSTPEVATLVAPVRPVILAMDTRARPPICVCKITAAVQCLLECLASAAKAVLSAGPVLLVLLVMVRSFSSFKFLLFKPSIVLLLQEPLVAKWMVTFVRPTTAVVHRKPDVRQIRPFLPLIATVYVQLASPAMALVHSDV